MSIKVREITVIEVINEGDRYYEKALFTQNGELIASGAIEKEKSKECLHLDMTSPKLQSEKKLDNLNH